MAVKIIIDRKVKKGKEPEFSELLKQLRIKGSVLKRVHFGGDAPRHYRILITIWSSAPGKALMIGSTRRGFG